MSANAAITMIHHHIPALKSLKAIGMEIGLQDGLLANNERIETRMLPFFSEHLAFK